MIEAKYSRQMALRIFSPDDQVSIKQKKVVIVGIGGNGSLAADLFVRLGIARLTIVDRDYVSISNIHRQILYTEKDVGEPKVEVAKRRLNDINSEVEISVVHETFDASNAERIVSSADLVFDGTDNLTTRFIINDACVKLNKPWIHTSAIETYGQVKAVIPHKTSCLRCYHSLGTTPQPSCAEVGVLSSVPSLVSAYGWTLAVRILLGKDVPGDLYYIDPWHLDFQQIRINLDENCPSCGTGKFEYLTDRYSNLGIRPLI